MRTRSLAPYVLAAVLLTGCTSGSSESTASPASADSGAMDTAAAAPPEAGAAVAAAPLARVAPGPQLIRTGSMEVVVDDVSAAADEAARLVTGAGGAVEADDRARDGGPERAVLTLRVAPNAFDATVDRLAGLGEERSRALGTKDVTDEVVDLDSRLATQRASVERVRALLGEADTLGEVVQVEAELTKRTADLESLEARLAALTGQVDLGTLELRLTASDDAPAAAGSALGFGDGLDAGWDALRAVGRAAGVTAGALLPWSPLLLLAGTGLWRTRRRTAGALPGREA